MKIKGLLLSLFVTSSLLSIAQDIKLPSPQKQGGEPLLQVLSKRASTRDFDTQKNIDSQTLSNLLWAAWGYNREDKRTAPSAMNRQEISLYIVMAQGVYLYDAKQNKLAEIAKGDFRENAGMQPFVHTAPLNIIFTANLEKAPGNDMMFAVFEMPPWRISSQPMIWRPLLSTNFSMREMT